MPALTWRDVVRLLDAGMTAEAERLALRLLASGPWAEDPAALRALLRLGMAFGVADGYVAVRRKIGRYDVTTPHGAYVIEAGTGAEAIALARARAATRDDA